MTVTVEVADKKADFGAHSWMLIDLLNEFYEDPENVKELEEWKKQREEKKTCESGTGNITGR